MTREDLIIKTYCLIDDPFENNNLFHFRKRVEKPALSDAEVITMEIIGEFLNHNTDKAIWVYFKEHWLHFFPKICFKQASQGNVLI